MTEVREKLLGKLILIGIAIFFSFIIVRSICDNGALESNYSLGKGKVISYGRGTKTSFYLDFMFIVDGKKIYGNTSYPFYENAGKKLVGKCFPVVYCNSNFSNNKMLILPDNFNEFHLHFPDSLEWVKNLPTL